MPETRDELDDVKADAAAYGRRLGLLLAAADMPAEQKEAWAMLIPQMTAQQMEDFAKALELRVSDAEEQAFGDLAARLKDANVRYADRVQAATAEAESALADVEKELKPPNA